MPNLINKWSSSVVVIYNLSREVGCDYRVSLFALHVTSYSWLVSLKGSNINNIHKKNRLIMKSTTQFGQSCFDPDQPMSMPSGCCWPIAVRCWSAGYWPVTRDNILKIGRSFCRIRLPRELPDEKENPDVALLEHVYRPLADVEWYGALTVGWVEPAVTSDHSPLSAVTSVGTKSKKAAMVQWWAVGRLLSRRLESSEETLSLSHAASHTDSRPRHSPQPRTQPRRQVGLCSQQTSTQTLFYLFIE